MEIYLLQVHLFREVGITRVAVAVINEYGRLDKTITVVSEFIRRD